MNFNRVTFLKVRRYTLMGGMGLVAGGWSSVMVAEGAAAVVASGEASSNVAIAPGDHLHSPEKAMPTPLMSHALSETYQTASPQFSTTAACLTGADPLLAQTPSTTSEPPKVPGDPAIEPTSPTQPSTPLDLPPEVIESSPVLREWLERTPNIADEIANDPSFRTRLRLGYSQFPSSGNVGGIDAGVEDVFVWPGTGLTLSGDYARSWNSDREAYGAQARFYVFPLGGYVNFAPVLGYRQLSTRNYTTSGVDVGMRLMLIPSRGGAADIALSQTWVAPGTQDEVGMTGASIGYAVTSHLRLSTDLQFQNSRFGQDSRLGLNLEWLL